MSRGPQGGHLAPGWEPLDCNVKSLYTYCIYIYIYIYIRFQIYLFSDILSWNSRWAFIYSHKRSEMALTIRTNIISLNTASVLRKLYSHFLSYWIGYDCGDSFLFDFEPNGIPFGSENRKENCHHDHIPFNVEGNVIIIFSVCARGTDLFPMVSLRDPGKKKRW